MSVIVRSKSGELEITICFIAGTVIDYRPSALTTLCVRMFMFVFLSLGDTILFCKGADSSIFPRVRQEEVEKVRMHVERNAKVGHSRFKFRRMSFFIQGSDGF